MSAIATRECNLCVHFFNICRLRIHSEAMSALHTLQSAPNADAIIISDANSVFIECILQECGVDDVFRAVFTNPASFNSDGLLTVAWYHTHNCQLCNKTPHMCKGTYSRLVQPVAGTMGLLCRHYSQELH